VIPATLDAAQMAEDPAVIVLNFP